MKEINDVPKDRLYASNHMWITILGKDIAILGMTSYARDCMRGILSIELPKLGKRIRQNDNIVTVETAKAILDIFSPLSGVILEVNEELKDNPTLLGKDPHGSGWIAKLKIIKINELEELMNHEKYIEYVEGMPQSAYSQNVRSKLYDPF